MKLFTRSVSAAQKSEGALWDFADAIVADLDEAKHIAPEGATYAAVADAIQADTGLIYSKGQIGMRARTARAFPPGKRSQKLSFTHHVNLSTDGLTDRRDDLLAQAETNRWTIDDLRIATDRAPTGMSPHRPTPEQIRQLKTLLDAKQRGKE